MTTIKYAVLVRDISESPQAFRLAHLYQHRGDADGCAAAYFNDLGVASSVAELSPALAIVRRADAWAVYNPDKGVVQVYKTREEAACSAKLGGALIEAPIRQAMPVQNGVPQFAPLGAASAKQTSLLPM